MQFKVTNSLADQMELAGFSKIRTKTIRSAAIADHTTRAEVGSDTGASSVNENSLNQALFAVPQGQTWTCIGALVTVRPTLTTVVNSGGLVEFECAGQSWQPCEYPTNLMTAVGANAGSRVEPLFIPLWKPVPTNGIIRAYYTALNAATDSVEITFYVAEKGFSGQQSYAEYNVGTAITQTTIAANHVASTPSTSINATIVGFLCQVRGTIETVVNSGGMVVVKSSQCPDIDRFQWTTRGCTSIGTGGSFADVQAVPCYGVYKAAQPVNFDYQPLDNQSQSLAISVVYTA